MYACSSHGKPTTHMSFMFVRQWNKAHHVTANESSHCAISTLHSKEKHLRISTVLPRVGLFGTLIPQASRSFARLLKDIALLHHFPTKLYDLIPKHFCATFTASPQWHFVVIFPRFATEPSPKCLSTPTSPKPPPQLLNNTLLHNSLIQSLPATARAPPYSRHPASTSWFFDNTSFRTKDWVEPYRIMNQIRFPLFSKMFLASSSTSFGSVPALTYLACMTYITSMYSLYGNHVFVYSKHLVYSVHRPSSTLSFS